MGSEPHQVHVVFFPFMAYGHMIPIVDIARLFAARGVKVTIFTTPHNAPIFSKTANSDTQLGIQIGLHITQFPSVEAGLPEGCENVNLLTSPDMAPNFFKAVGMLQEPFEQFLEDHHPDCVVSDMFLPWTNDAANKFGIPRLVFHGTSFFSLCVTDSFRRYAPHRNVTSDTEPFIVPGIPDQIEITRLQLADDMKEKSETKSEFSKIIDHVRETDERSYGVLVNSFYELEPAYADHYRKVMGRKAWHIGPVSLCNRDITDKAQRGKVASIDQHECLSWLDSKKPKSVLYICFGSTANFPKSQLLEIAMGLEASGQSFIWVVRNQEKSSESSDDQQWLPQGFEQRMEGKGLIIRGWAPQVMILDHQAIGGFMTHCGWNSTFEGVSSGVPMITWPLFAEQFYNEKLVTQVLKIGIAVGAPQWIRWLSSNKEDKVLVKRDAIEKAVSQLMDDGEETEQMRSRAWEYRETAKKAVEEGGSSYTSLTDLIDELISRRQQ